MFANKLKETRTDYQFMEKEVATLRQQLSDTSKRKNELIVDNENILRKHETSQKMIKQLNNHVIDIQYKSDKLIERKVQEFSQIEN